MVKQGLTRHQKSLKSEKNKVKLKAKKELPKGTNITNTNFKVKKIVIREQLKTHQDWESLSSKKQNIKELLTRLNHFNVNAKTESLKGLKELITNYDDVLKLNLGQLVHAVTPLSLNIEKSIRREAYILLQVILTKSPDDNIIPFFDIILSYLGCAMTHIDNRIQEDSLLFMDTLLITSPERVARNVHRIIPNFMDMISKLKVESKPGRMLTVDLGSKMTSVMWRVKVLNRFHEFLKIMVGYKTQIQKSNTKNVESNILFYDSETERYPIFNKNKVTLCELPCFTSNSNSIVYSENDEIEKIKSYVQTLVPLLYETWLEVKPEVSTTEERRMESVLPRENAALLQNLLAIMLLLWRYIKYFKKDSSNIDLGMWFADQFRKDFTRHILPNIPYVTNMGKSKSKLKGLDVEYQVEPKMTAENLDICYLFVCLNGNVNINSQANEVGKVLNYLKKTFSQDLSESHGQKIMELLRMLFSNESKGWTNKTNTMDALLDKVISCYRHESFSNKMKQDVFSLLCNILLNDKMSKFQQTDSFQAWLNNFPDIFCENNINEQAINALHKLATQNNKMFNEIFCSKIPIILKNLPSLEIVAAKNERIAKQRLLSLLYWLNRWDNDSLNLLENQLSHNLYEENTRFILEILNFKSAQRK